MEVILGYFFESCKFPYVFARLVVILRLHNWDDPFIVSSNSTCYFPVVVCFGGLDQTQSCLQEKNKRILRGIEGKIIKLGQYTFCQTTSFLSELQ